MRIPSFISRLKADVSSLAVDTSLPASGLGKVLVRRTSVPCLHATLRDRVRPAKWAEHVGQELGEGQGPIAISLCISTAAPSRARTWVVCLVSTS